MSLIGTELRHELRRTFRRWAHALPVFVAILFGWLAVELWSSSLGRGLDVQTLRSFFAVRGERPAPQELVIVGIDGESFTELGLPPRTALPRKYFADLIERVVAAAPKMLIIDASFPAEDLDPDANRRIAGAMKSIPVAIGAGKMNTGLEANPFVTIPSDPIFREAAKLEMSMLFNSVDGVTSLLTLNTEPSATLFDRVPLAKPLVEFGDYKIALPEPMALINFYGPPGTIARVSMGALLRAEVDDEQLVRTLHGKVVLLGYQTIPTVDQKRGATEIDKEEFYTSGGWTPMFGVETHATVVGNLMDGSWLRRFSLTAEVGWLLFAGMGFGLISFYFTPERAAVLILGVLASLTLCTYTAFAWYQFWIPGLATLAIVAIVALLVGALYHLGHLERLQSFVRRVFGARAT